MNKKWLVKTLAIAIVLVFIDVSVAQGITSNSKQLSKTNDSQNIILGTKKVELTCSCFKLNGVEKVVKEVTAQEANYLSQLMNDSDDDAIVSELARLNLLPKTVSIEQAKELVSGRYGQEIFQKSQNLSHLNQLNDTDWRENFYCNISGFGHDAYFMTLRMHLLSTALGVILSLIIWPFAFPLLLLCSRHPNNLTIFLICIVLLTIITSPLAILRTYQAVGQIFNSIKITPGQIGAVLYDAIGDGNPYLNTSGRNETWGFENNYRGIAIYMNGFYGIWLSINDGRQVPGANVKGYCTYIKAKGLDDWPWDPWTGKHIPPGG